MDNVKNSFARYRETMPEHRRMLPDHYKLMDIALKVVGVGSVGTACWVILMKAVRAGKLEVFIEQEVCTVDCSFARSHTASRRPAFASGS